MSETAGRKVWRRASRCESTACVEVALGEERVHVRNSDGSADHALSFTVVEWQTFIEAAKAGEFDAVAHRPQLTDAC